MPFYPAEDEHQKYYLKNPEAYEAYHVGSGRVGYLAKIWWKESSSLGLRLSVADRHEAAGRRIDADLGDPLRIPVLAISGADRTGFSVYRFELRHLHARPGISLEGDVLRLVLGDFCRSF